MSTGLSLPITSSHVAYQFARRGDLAAAQFLYGEISQRMLARLRMMRIQPACILDAGCGAGASMTSLRARYPKAEYIGLDHCPPLLAIARKRYAPTGLLGLFHRFAHVWQRGAVAAKPPRFINADLAASGLPSESLDLVWSNLALHWHPQPHNVLAEWRRVLKVQGLVLFSSLGPASLREVRQAVATAALKTQTLNFVDMHDFGDLLIENGFTDPVMEQETLTLTYQTPQQLLKELHALGGNPSIGRKASLATPAWHARLCAALEKQRRADGVIPLTIEVAYGHAWRAGTHRAANGETRLSVHAIGGRRSR